MHSSECERKNLSGKRKITFYRMVYERGRIKDVRKRMKEKTTKDDKFILEYLVVLFTKQ